MRQTVHSGTKYLQTRRFCPCNASSNNAVRGVARRSYGSGADASRRASSSGGVGVCEQRVVDLQLDDVELPVGPFQRQVVAAEAAFENREGALRPRSGEWAGLRDRGVAAGVAELGAGALASRGRSRPAARHSPRATPLAIPPPPRRSARGHRSRRRPAGTASRARPPSPPRSARRRPRRGSARRARPGSRRRRRRAPWESRSDGWRRRRAGRPSGGDAPRLAVDVQTAVPHEAAERDPRSAARETASDDGAPTAASTGHPATAAFCTSSNESRPLTQRIEFASGSRPA